MKNASDLLIRRCGGRISCCMVIPIALVVIVIVGYILVILPIWRAGTIPKQLTLQEIADVAHVELPPSSRLLNSYLLGFRDFDMLAKIQIPSADLRVLLKSLPKERQESYSDRLGIDSAGFMVPEWWDPGSANKYLAIRTHAAREDAMLWVLAGKDDPKQTIVYVCVVTD